MIRLLIRPSVAWKDPFALGHKATTRTERNRLAVPANLLARLLMKKSTSCLSPNGSRYTASTIICLASLCEENQVTTFHPHCHYKCKVPIAVPSVTHPASPNDLPLPNEANLGERASLLRFTRKVIMVHSHLENLNAKHRVGSTVPFVVPIWK